MTKRICKFRTGSEVPKGAVYLSTIRVRKFVLHYFLADVADKKPTKVSKKKK